jgi:hypothetical protein
MRRFALLAATLLFNGCNSSPTDRLPSSGGSDLISMLRDGSAQACSDGDVKRTVIEAITPDYEPGNELLKQDIDVGLNSIALAIDTISLKDVKKDVAEVTCDANLVISVPNNPKRTYSIGYIVRPSAEDNSAFVVQGDYGEAATAVASLVSGAISRARADRLAAANASAISEPADVDPEEYNETNPDEAAEQTSEPANDENM